MRRSGADVPLPPASGAIRTSGTTGALVAVGAAIVVGGISFTQIKVVLGTLTPLGLTAGRVGISALAFLLVVALQPGRRTPVAREDRVVVLACGFGGSAVFHPLFAWGQGQVPVAVTAVVLGCMPVCAAALEVAFLRHRLGPAQLAGLVLSVAGVAVMALSGGRGVRGGEGGAGGPGGPGGLDVRWVLGFCAVAAATLVLSAVTVATRSLGDRYDPWWLNTPGTALGAVVVLGVVALSGDGQGYQQLGASGWAQVVWLGAVGSAFVYAALARAVRNLSATTTAGLSTIVTPFGVVVAWGVLGERPTLLVVLGGAVVVAGALLVTAAPPPSRSAPRPRPRVRPRLRPRVRPLPRSRPRRRRPPGRPDGTRDADGILGRVPAPSAPGLPIGTPLVLDPRVRVWRDGSVVLGGAPWGVLRLAPPARALVRRAVGAGSHGVPARDEPEQAAADRLVARGILHPVVPPAARPVEVVVPAYGRPDLLHGCLASLGHRPGEERTPVVVVDDASPAPDVGDVARAHGARLLRHRVNRGPAAARNTGLAATSAPVVAFVDADCTVTPGWLDGLLPLFDDPRVGAVAPRVSPRAERRSLLARHEAARSALDMGPRRELVRHGAPLGFLPSATLLVRRAAIESVGVGGAGFDERMRIGEDVDLVWRLLADGWLVRYEPTVVVHHEMRLEPVAWARRRLEYGTSAAALDTRHPGRLVPARVSGWNVAVAATAIAGRPWAAAGVALAATGALGYRLRGAAVDPAIAPVVVGKGLLADGAAVGHALRREWWPVGWTALAAAPRSRVARAAAVSMLAPVALEWVRQRPEVDLFRYTLLRLAEDAAYGTGVLLSAVRGRRPGVLVPEVRLPFPRPPAPVPPGMVSAEAEPEPAAQFGRAASS